MNPSQPPPSPKLLYIYSVVIQSGSLSAAGGVLARAPTAISRSLDELEKRLGCSLLTRGRQGVMPTAAGAALARRALPLLQILTAMPGGERLSHAEQKNWAGVLAMRIDLTRLMALVDVARTQSVTRTAERLNLTQPAVSIALRSLEDMLGVALFQRGGGRMHLTVQGRAATLVARRVLAGVERIRDAIVSLDGPPRGRLAVGALAYSRAALVPDAIAEIQRLAPALVIETVEGPAQTLLDGVQAGEIDLMVAAEPRTELTRGLASQVLLTDRMDFIVDRDHPLGVDSGSPVDLDQILQFPIILPVRGSTSRKALDDLLQQVGQSFAGACVETSADAVIRQLLRGSNRIGFRSRAEFAWEIEMGLLRPLPVDLPLPERKIVLIYSRRSLPTPAAELFIQLLNEIAENKWSATELSSSGN